MKIKIKDYAHTLRAEILEKVREFHATKEVSKQAFRPGVDQVHYAGRVHDDDELATDLTHQQWPLQ